MFSYRLGERSVKYCSFKYCEIFCTWHFAVSEVFFDLQSFQTIFIQISSCIYEVEGSPGTD